MPFGRERRQLLARFGREWQMICKHHQGREIERIDVEFPRSGRPPAAGVNRSGKSVAGSASPPVVVIFRPEVVTRNW